MWISEAKHINRYRSFGAHSRTAQNQSGYFLEILETVIVLSVISPRNATAGSVGKVGVSGELNRDRELRRFRLGWFEHATLDCMGTIRRVPDASGLPDREYFL